MADSFNKQQVQKVYKEDINHSIKLMDSYLNADIAIDKAVTSVNKYALACIKIIDEIQKSIKNGENKDNIANLAVQLVQYISKNNGVFKGILSKAADYINNLVILGISESVIYVLIESSTPVQNRISLLDLSKYSGIEKDEKLEGYLLDLSKYSGIEKDEKLEEFLEKAKRLRAGLTIVVNSNEGMIEKEFSKELEEYGSISFRLNSVADMLRDVLKVLAYCKTILLYECGKVNLPKTVDDVYVELANEIIPAYEKMSRDVKNMFADFHANNTTSLHFLDDPELQPSNKVVQTVNVKGDDFSY